MSSIRTQITTRIATLLQGIKEDWGYQTNIGRLVHVGLSAGNAGEAPCVFLTPGGDRGAVEYGNALTETEYVVTAFVNRRDEFADSHASDPDADWAKVDEILADVRMTMESRDASLYALIERIQYESGKPAYSEDAGELIGAELKYTIQYRIALGDPYNLPS